MATSKFSFEVLKTCKQSGARLGLLHTPHGDIHTPVYMPVGTVATVKAMTPREMLEIGTEIMLSNTYHLHLRPGEDLIREAGGLHKFMSWPKPILTDSGGFQVFSLAQLRNITEEGVAFASHMDGAHIFMSPESSMQIQSKLASTIAMAFDECPSSVAERSYIQQSCARTVRWLYRCRDEMARLNGEETTINRKQLLFGINQGGIYEDIRIENMKQIAELELDGYAIGGLAVGESAEEMYRIIETVEPYMPADRPRYLMGVGTPVNILEAVERGVDFFDCVMPSRNARHGNLFTSVGFLNLNNRKYFDDARPIDPDCGCPACRSYSRAYIRHLFKARELLGMRLCVLHNLYFYNRLMEDIRSHLEAGTFSAFKRERVPVLGRRAED